nr:coiled-coil domain-containing protein 57 isoform X5 [Manis javanica]
MRKREHEFHLQAGSMSSVALAHELRVKLLNKQLMTLEEAGAKAAESLQRAETVNLELKQKLQRQAWEVRDLAAVKDARIKDLECKLHSVRLSWKKEEETFRRKHEELERVAREREAVLAAANGAHVEQLQALEARALELQAQCETLELQLRRTQWRQGDALKEKDAVIYKLQEDASTLKSSQDAQIARLSKEMVSKDLQIQSLQKEEVTLKAQLARCHQDIGRYQQQLSLAVEREQTLGREKVQLGLDWQRRCDSIEQSHCQRSEDLIQGLITAREQVAAKLQKTEQMLCDQEVVLKALTLERDQAVQALRTRGLVPEEEVQWLLRRQEDVTERPPPSEVQRLQEQNASLREAVARMREDMEALSGRLLPSALLGGEAADSGQRDPKVAADAAIPDYVLVLEAEILNLKDKFKTLEAQLDVSGPSKRSSSHTDIQPRFPPTMESAGGAAPEGSMSTGSALRRLGDRVHLLNFLVARLRQQVQQEPLDIDTIQRELPHQVDQVHLEVLELHRQVAELEKRLGTRASSRRQLGSLDAGALRRQDPIGEGHVETRDRRAQAPDAMSVHRLQRKLKEAARKVLHLGLEKEQLLEMGNRLRAERGRPLGDFLNRWKTSTRPGKCLLHV